MSTQSKLTKVAMIRDNSFPVGTMAPLYLKCPCGEKNQTNIDLKENITCKCGQEFTYNGWLI